MKQGKGMDWHVSAGGWNRVHAAGCSGKTKVWHPDSVCGRWFLHDVYSWHNTGLRWMCKFAAKYKIK